MTGLNIGDDGNFARDDRFEYWGLTAVSLGMTGLNIGDAGSFAGDDGPYFAY
jgi:hypothetical protein